MPVSGEASGENSWELFEILSLVKKDFHDSILESWKVETIYWRLPVDSDIRHSYEHPNRKLSKHSIAIREGIVCC